MTQKRAAILQVLRESEGHLPADEIFARVKEKCPGIVLATVYNNLHALVAEGHILHIRTAAGPDFYDKTPTQHEHAFCTECGKVIDVELGDLIAEFSAKAGIPIYSYDLVLHTRCEGCAKKYNKRRA